jgi:hypothetical protein
LIIVWGVILWRKLPDCGEYRESILDEAINDKKIPAYRIYHARRYGGRWFTDMVEKVNNPIDTGIN